MSFMLLPFSPISYFVNLRFTWAYLIWTLDENVLEEHVYMFTVSLENKTMPKTAIKYRLYFYDLGDEKVSEV